MRPVDVRKLTTPSEATSSRRGESVLRPWVSALTCIFIHRQRRTECRKNPGALHYHHGVLNRKKNFPGPPPVYAGSFPLPEPLYPHTEHPGMSYPGRDSEISTRFSFAYESTPAERQTSDPPRQGGKQDATMDCLTTSGHDKCLLPSGRRGRDMTRSSRSVARVSPTEVSFDAVHTESLD